MKYVIGLTLAVAIGANTVIFSLVNSILLRPLPYLSSGRIQWISEHMGRDQREVGLGSDYYSLRDQGRLFDAIAAFQTFTVNWNGIDRPEQLDVAHASTSFFQVMGRAPLLGRYFEEGEQKVAVVSYPFWRSRLSADPQALGKSLSLDGIPHTIVGVMPQGFDFPKGTQIWRPLTMTESSQRPRSVMRPVMTVNMVARVKEGVTDAVLEAEMARLTSVIRAEWPREFDAAERFIGYRITAEPLQRRITGDVRPALLVLSGAAGLVLLIACANLANLLLARSAAREREMAIRLALGATPGRIVRQVLGESLLLAVPGGVAGVLLATTIVSAINRWKPLALDRYPEISLDWRTLFFTAAITMLTGLLFGLAPALGSARASFKPAGTRTTTRVRRSLVVVELSVSLMLLIGAGLLGRSFLKLARTEIGFPTANLLTLRVNVTGPRYLKPDNFAAFYDDVLGRIRQLPMVRHAAVATELPLGGDISWSRMNFQISGRAPLPMAQQPHAEVMLVSRDFFNTLAIPLQQGSPFDLPDSAVVNEAFVRQVFGAEVPIGRRIVSGRDDGNQWTITAVVGNVRSANLGAQPAPLIYRCTCQAQRPFLSRMGLVVQTAGDPRAAIRSVAEQLYAVDREQPVFDVKTMDERVAGTLAPQRFNLMLIGAFAAIAIVLAALGVYGVMSYLVQRRTREIGIRIALGAVPTQVLAAVLEESAVLASIAVAFGLAGAWGLTRYLQSMLFGVTALDGVTFIGMAVLLAAVAIGSAWGPAQRAARVDPMTALRVE